MKISITLALMVSLVVSQAEESNMDQYDGGYGGFSGGYDRGYEIEVTATGKYDRVSEEKCDDFLKALGVDYFHRVAATHFTPAMEVSELGGDWYIKTFSPAETMELNFRVGEAFDETTPDGREFSTVVTIDGNKLISEQTAKNAWKTMSTKTVREFTGGECIVTMTIVGQHNVCIQKFKKR